MFPKASFCAAILLAGFLPVVAGAQNVPAAQLPAAAPSASSSPGSVQNDTYNPLAGAASTDIAATISPSVTGQADPNVMLDHFLLKLTLVDERIDDVHHYTMNPGQTLAMPGGLAVTAVACVHDNQGISDNDAAYLQVQDQQTESILFKGWMLRLAPGLSDIGEAEFNLQVDSCDPTKPDTAAKSPAPKPTPVTGQ